MNTVATQQQEQQNNQMESGGESQRGPSRLRLPRTSGLSVPEPPSEAPEELDRGKSSSQDREVQTEEPGADEEAPAAPAASAVTSLVPKPRSHGLKLSLRSKESTRVPGRAQIDALRRVSQSLDRNAEVLGQLVDVSTETNSQRIQSTKAQVTASRAQKLLVRQLSRISQESTEREQASVQLVAANTRTANAMQRIALAHETTLQTIAAASEFAVHVRNRTENCDDGLGVLCGMLEGFKKVIVDRFTVAERQNLSLMDCQGRLAVLMQKALEAREQHDSMKIKWNEDYCRFMSHAMEHMQKESQLQQVLLDRLEKQAELVPHFQEQLQYFKEFAQQRLDYDEMTHMLLANRESALVDKMGEVVVKCIEEFKESKVEEQVAMHMRIAAFPQNTQCTYPPPVSLEHFKELLSIVLERNYAAYKETFQPLIEGFNASTGKLQEFLRDLSQRASHEQVMPRILYVHDERQVLQPVPRIGCHRPPPAGPTIVELTPSREVSAARSEPANEQIRVTSPPPRTPTHSQPGQHHPGSHAPGG